MAIQVEFLERVFGCSLETIPVAFGRGLAPWRRHCDHLLDGLDRYYSSIGPPHYDPSELFVHTYDIEDWHGSPEYLGMPHWRDTPTLSDVKAVLLYAHRARAIDPLPWALAHIRDGVEYISPATNFALSFWNDAEPLVDAGVLQVVRPPWFAQANAKAPHTLFPRLDPADFGLTNSSVDERTWLDVDRALTETDGAQVDVWFPTARHRTIFAAIASKISLRPRDPLYVPEAVPLPSVQRVDIKTIIDMRLNDDAFEAWRRELRLAISELRELRVDSDTEDSTVAEIMKMASAGVANNLNKELRQRGVDYGTIPFTLGLLGAAAATPIAGVASGLGAAAAVAVGAIGASIVNGARNQDVKRAEHAFQRLALVL